MEANENKYFLILDNIRSSENVGAIFRTADAVGISKILLTGVTPCPVDRFGRVQNKIAKTALGAELSVPWEYFESTELALKSVRTLGFEVVALEQSKIAIDYKKYQTTKDTAFVVGREVDGLPKNVLAMCDAVCEIPMQGGKESLNVSVATGVFLFRALDR